MVETEDDIRNEKSLLETRRKEYERSQTKHSEQGTAKKKSARHNIIKCKIHEDGKNDHWLAENTECKLCLKIGHVTTFKPGLLPRTEEVLSARFSVIQSGEQTNWASLVATMVCNIWISCNVYPMSLRTVEREISSLYDEYRAIKKYSKKSEAYWSKCTPFLEKMSTLFNVVASEERRKLCEGVYKVTMTKTDFLFFEGQKLNPPVGYCDSGTSGVDKKWAKNAKRKAETEERMNKSSSSANSSFDMIPEDSLNEICGPSEDVFSHVNDEDEFTAVDDGKKKRKFEHVLDSSEDDLPFVYRHVRNGPRSVRPEIYEVIIYLESKYHLSHRQAIAAITTVANKLFGREKYGEWKEHVTGAVSDENTMPATSNTRRVEPYMEAMALSSIVDEIMSNDGDNCVILSGDGSSNSGVGAYVVQSFVINGVPRTLPTLAVCTESREVLAELQKFILRMLSASTGFKYSQEDILRRIRFVMSDSTAHNLNVIEQVCEDLEVEDVPNTLLCNVHPLMLFQRKIKELCQLVHDQLGAQKLSDCFLVDIDFRSESFVVKAIRCLTNFINCENSEKPWNYCTHFEMFIDPKKNMSLSLKDHRFNRLQDCALACLHHLQDISDYLLKFPSITNGIAILDRSFVDMEILKPILTTIALLGIHITRPFQSLMLDTCTTYSTLLSAFKELYENFSIPPERYLTTDYVATFVSKDMFENSLPDKCMLETVNHMIVSYRGDIEILLRLSLNMFAEGFSHQKGAIFGFGPNKDDDCATVLKISTLDEQKLKELDDNAPVHNLLSERQVGEVNYGLHIRGKKNLATVSRKMVINKCIDLLQKKESGQFRKYHKEAAEIKEIKLEWNSKMKELQERGYQEKEITNSLKEKSKLEDLDYLKQRNGPFVKKEEIEEFMNSEAPDEEKRERLYKEVRYARMTSQTLPPTAAVFRLRTKGNKYLLVEEYARNLGQYLDDSHCVTKVTLDDFHQVLLEVEAKKSQDTQQTTVAQETKSAPRNQTKPKSSGQTTKKKKEQNKSEESSDVEVRISNYLLDTVITRLLCKTYLPSYGLFSARYCPRHAILFHCMTGPRVYFIKPLVRRKPCVSLVDAARNCPLYAIPF